MRDRWLRHERDCDGTGVTYKHRIIFQMKSRGITVPKRKVAEGLSNADAVALEIKLIAEFGRHPSGPLVNATSGGEGMPNPSPETRAKLVAERRSRRFSDEKKARYSAAQRRRTYWPKASEATKSKMRAARLGRKISDEAKAKIGAANRGRPKTPETLEKMRAAGLAFPMTEARIAYLERIALAKKNNAKYPLHCKDRRWVNDGRISYSLHYRVPLPSEWTPGRLATPRKMEA